VNALKIIFVIVVALIVLRASAVLQKSTCRKQVEGFLSKIIEGEMDSAYDEIFSEAIKQGRPQAIQAAKAQAASTINMCGKPLDYEFIKRHKYGNSIVRLIYVLRTNKLPITWEFYFYKLGSDWLLTSAESSDQYKFLQEN
jgi:hypothetical protein